MPTDYYKPKFWERVIERKDTHTNCKPTPYLELTNPPRGGVSGKAQASIYLKFIEYVNPHEKFRLNHIWLSQA